MKKISNPPMSWLLLVHHIPPKPGYLRAKVAKRLAGLGAVPLKNAVYAMPDSEQAREDLGWLAHEINQGGGKSFVCRSTLIAGLDDAAVRALFQAAREEDYMVLVAEARGLAQGERSDDLARGLSALQERKNIVGRLDFFGTPSRETLEGLLAELEQRVINKQGQKDLAKGPTPKNLKAFQGKVWVTRRGVHVDRIASAWLIRRFIDPKAAFRFVDAREHVPGPNEVRFDMNQAEFTHEGEMCTFETLISRLSLRDPALVKLGEMVHDIDLKEDRFAHPETKGLMLVLAGIALAHSEDDIRIDQGIVILDAIYNGIRLKKE